LAPSGWKGKEEEAVGRGENCGGAQSGKAEEGKKGGRKGNGAPTGGAGVSAAVRKKEKGEEEVGRSGDGEMGRWAGWVRKGVRPFFFSFSTQIKPTFKLKFIQNFSNFFTKFYKPFGPHTSNQKPCIAK
jgi:hypothetical protein